MKILDRYVVSEMLGPFFFGVATFTILFFAGGQMTIVTRLVAEGGASIAEALRYAMDSLPAIFVLTFPMAVLLASLMAFGRLSGESEITALRAGGVGFIRTAIPAVLLSLLITISVFLVNNYIAPDATYRARNLFIDHFLKTDESIVENMIIRETDEQGVESVIFFKKLVVKENRMENVTVQYFEKGKRIREVFADSAFWRPEQGHWFLRNAIVNSFDKNQESQYEAKSDEIIMPLKKSPQQLSTRLERRHEEMNLAMLTENIERMRGELAKMHEGDPAEIAKLQKRINLFQVSYQEKVAIPFTCLVFGLFGIPLGIRPHRTSKAFGLGLSIVFIFIYYVLMSSGHTLGENGHLSPIVAAWSPNILFGVAGIILIFKQARE